MVIISPTNGLRSRDGYWEESHQTVQECKLQTSLAGKTSELVKISDSASRTLVHSKKMCRTMSRALPYNAVRLRYDCSTIRRPRYDCGTTTVRSTTEVRQRYDYGTTTVRWGAMRYDYSTMRCDEVRLQYDCGMTAVSPRLYVCIGT